MDSATWGKIEERKFEVFFCSEKICHANLTWTHGNLRIWKWYFLSILILLEYPSCFFSSQAAFDQQGGDGLCGGHLSYEWFESRVVC